MTDMFSAIVETMRQPVLVLDSDQSVRLANKAFFETFGVNGRETLGHPLRTLGNGQWDIPELRALLADILPNDTKVENYRVEHEFDGIGRRAMLLNARVLTLDGDDNAILLAVSDVTEKERLENELIARAEFSEKLIDSIRDTVLVLHCDLVVESANEAFYRMFDTRPEVTEGQYLFDLGNGQWDIPELRKALEDILPERQSFDDFEVTHEFPKVGRRSILLNGRRLDHLPRILLVMRDETDRKRHTADQRVLVGELQHRVKNILANVQSIATATIRRSETLKEFEAAYFDRLGSLARAHELLTRAAEGSVDLGELITRELEAHGWEADGRLDITGSAVNLSRKDTQPVAMIIHELATNAVKHGAFATPAGRLDIHWTVERDRETGENRVTLEWRETGVQIEAPPKDSGYGTGLIEHSVWHMLGGQSTLEFAPDGVKYRMAFMVEQG